MKYLFISLLMLLHITSRSQSFSDSIKSGKQFYSHGTISVAIICTDGILLAIDSRITYFEGAAEITPVIAWIDSCSKIVTIGKYKMAVIGSDMKGYKYIYQLADSFNKKKRNDAGISKTFSMFKEFVKDKFKVDSTEFFNGNNYIMAGYEKKSPLIYHVYSSNKIVIRNEMLAIEIGQGNKEIDFFKVFDTFVKGDEKTCDQILPVLEKSIYKYSSETGRLYIGGPLLVFKINMDNSVVSVRSFHIKRFNSVREFANSVISGKTKVNYPNERGKEIFLQRMKKGLTVNY
jgi:20S proteasome alpha/beta subunit